MKMRITVEGKVYDVDVEILDGPAERPAAPPASPRRAAPPPPAPTPPTAPPQPLAAPRHAGAGAPGDVPSPIAGNVVRIAVQVGQRIAVNDTLLVLEAMKMETNVASPVAGVVKELCVAPGATVRADQILLRIG